MPNNDVVKVFVLKSNKKKSILPHIGYVNMFSDVKLLKLSKKKKKENNQ